MPATENFREMSQETTPGLFQEFWLFLSQNKKWWLMPILVVILLMGALVFLSSSAAAPFVYTLF